MQAIPRHLPRSGVEIGLEECMYLLVTVVNSYVYMQYVKGQTSHSCDHNKLTSQIYSLLLTRKNLLLIGNRNRIIKSQITIFLRKIYFTNQIYTQIREIDLGF